MNVGVKVDAGRVTVAVAAFRLGISERRDLLQVIGEGQMASIYRTFQEEGSPSGSWPRLAPSTLKKKGYGEGHKLLILRGNLRNSIQPQVVDENTLLIGSNLVYAAVHQFGSRDRGARPSSHESTGVSGTIANVRGHSRRVKSRDQVTTYWKGGRTHIRTVAKGKTEVRSHSRSQNIPPRPYLVFRPEDPDRIAQEVKLYIDHVAASAGLEAV